MKRLLVLFAMLVSLSLFATGCGDTGGKSAKSSSGISPEEKQKMQEKMQWQMKSGKPNSAGMPAEAAKK